MLFPSTNAIVLVTLLAIPVHLMPLANDDKYAKNNNSPGLTGSGIMKGLTTGLALSSCLPGADSARSIQQVQGMTANYVTAHASVPQPPAAQHLDQMLPPVQMKMTSDPQASLSTVHQRKKTTSIKTTEHKSKDKKKCKKHPEKCHNGVYDHSNYHEEDPGCCHRHRRH